MSLLFCLGGGGARTAAFQLTFDQFETKEIS
jgi:hypothetical protein